MVEELENPTDTKNITFNENMVNVTGPGTNYSIIFMPKELTITDADTNSIKFIFVEVSHRKKKANCKFIVTIQGKANEKNAVKLPVEMLHS